MPTRAFTFCIGLLYAVIGVLTFIPAVRWPPPDRPMYDLHGVTTAYGFLFGYVPVNAVLAALYLILGAAGLVMAVVCPLAQLYTRGLMVLMFGLLMLCITPFSAQTLWGLLPLFAWNTPLYLITALLAWYFGFIHAEKEVASC